MSEIRAAPASARSSFFRTWRFAALILLLVLLLGNIKLLLGHVAPQWDAADFFGPEFSLVADHVKAGRLLLWNPWANAGSPDFAEPELGTVSPLILLVGFIAPSPWSGFVAYWLIIWYAGGLGILLLGRHLNAPIWGALIVALGYVTCGFYTTSAEYTSSVYSVSCLPFIVWLFDQALQRRSYWLAVQAGALFGLSALGGYPEFTILTAGLLAFWALGRSFWPNDSEPGSTPAPRRLLRAALLLTLAGFVGSVVLSPSYVALVKESRGYSDRVGPRTREEAISSGPFPFSAVSTFASPYLYLLNSPPSIWPGLDVSMSSIYVGALTLLMSLYSLRQKARWRLWLLFVGLFFLCCAFGRYLPLRGWLYDFVPPTRYFRNPALFKTYTIFLFAVLALLGARDLDRDKRSGPSALLRIAIALACGAFVAFPSLIAVADKKPPGFPLAIQHLVLVWLAMAVLVYLRHKQTLKPQTFHIALIGLAVLDSLFTLHITQPTLYSGIPTTSEWALMNAEHRRNLFLDDPKLKRDLYVPAKFPLKYNVQNLPLKVAAFNTYVVLQNRFQENILADPALRQMALGTDRICFAQSAPTFPPDDTVFNAFAARVHEIGHPVLILHSREQMQALTPRTIADRVPPPAPPINLGPTPPCAVATVYDVSYGPNLLSFRYRASSDGWLLVTDRWAPSWRVTVNGREQVVMGANFLFRAVHVSAGENTIQFRYRPLWFIVLVIASWTAILVAMLPIHRWQASRAATPAFASATWIER